MPILKRNIMLKKISLKSFSFVKRNYLLICSLIISILIIQVGVNISHMDEQSAQQILNFTGTLVIFLSVFLYIYSIFILKIKKSYQLVLSVGAFSIAFEYLMSVVFKINLNIYGSMFWCDIGLILLLTSLIKICTQPLLSKFMQFLKYKKNNKSIKDK